MITRNFDTSLSVNVSPKVQFRCRSRHRKAVYERSLVKKEKAGIMQSSRFSFPKFLSGPCSYYARATLHNPTKTHVDTYVKLQLLFLTTIGTVS